MAKGSKLAGALARGPKEKVGERLSPGVYRGDKGGLVNRSGAVMQRPQTPNPQMPPPDAFNRLPGNFGMGAQANPWEGVMGKGPAMDPGFTQFSRENMSPNEAARIAGMYAGYGGQNAPASVGANLANMYGKNPNDIQSGIYMAPNMPQPSANNNGQYRLSPGVYGTRDQAMQQFNQQNPYLMQGVPQQFKRQVMAFQGFTMPPPYGGLDLVSPIDNMDATSALELVNVFPGAGAPTVRLGYEQFCDVGAVSPLRSLSSLNLKDGSTQLVACSTDKIHSINTSGTSTNITGSTTPTSGEWQTTTYANNLYLCNGTNNAQVYTGTSTCSDVTFTGVTKSSLVNVTSYKERLYFVEINTAKVWYGGLQVTGTGGTPALTAFDFQYVFSRGGRLVGIGSYSNSANVAAQDYFWACSSEGEIVFYSGTYAGDPTTWGLVARYYIGKPLGYRAFVRVNNEVWIITEQGIVPVSGLFQADPEAALNVLSRNVNPLISEAASSVGFDHQWSGFFWPQGRRVYITIPTTGLGCKWLVYSIDTKGWTVFQLFNDEHALASTLFNNKPYYGSSTGIVWKGETGQADAKTATDSQSISYSGRTAFSFYGSRGNYKAFKDIRPIIRTKRGITLNLGLDVDFRRMPTVTAVTTPAGIFTPWGSPWGSPWSADIEYIFDRYAVKGQGHCAAVRFGGAIKNSTMQILGFEIRYDLGGQV